MSRIKKSEKAYLSLQPVLKMAPQKKKLVVQKKTSSRPLIPRTTLHKSGKSLAVTAIGTGLVSRAMTG